MDILFPWRRQSVSSSTRPIGGSQSATSSTKSGPYHSLPHPEEAAGRYNYGGRYHDSGGTGSLRGSVNSRSVYSSVMGDSRGELHQSGHFQSQDPLEISDTERTQTSVRFSDEQQYVEQRQKPRANRGGPLQSSIQSRQTVESDTYSQSYRNMDQSQSYRSLGGDGYDEESYDDAFESQRSFNTREYMQQSYRSVGEAGLSDSFTNKQDRRNSYRSVDEEQEQFDSLRQSFAGRNQALLQPSSSSRRMDMVPMEEEEEEDLPPSQLRQLLDAINMSILPNTLRLSSLAQAVEFFDHRDRAMHDLELQEGAAYVLYHKLGMPLRLSKGMDTEENEAPSSLYPKNHMMTYQQHLASSTAMHLQSEYDKEIAMICSCLEMVHRASPDSIAQTWDECGVEILPLLVSVLERPFLKIERAVWMAMQEKANVPGSLERAAAVAVTRDQKLAVQKVTKVLAMYSLVPEAKQPMCACQGMLRWLTRIIDTHNYNRVKPGVASGNSKLARPNDPEDVETENDKRLELASHATSGSGLYMTEAARFNTIATLTNLAAFEGNRMQMLQEPGLIDNVCRAVHNERSDVPKQCSALAIMNLSNGDPEHVPEMASNDLVLETLLKLMKEDNPETRRNAVVTIFNIACSDQNTVRLARYRDGTILEALTNLVGSDDPVRLHDEARANAAETIFNMSCSEISETTDRMANHAGLLECLAVTLRSGDHTGLEVKMYCSATLRRMAELIRYPMIAQGALLSALVKASTWTSTDCIAEAFHAQASVPDNCVIMAHHHGLLNSLSRLALTKGTGEDVDKVRDAAVAAIELMSRHDEARELLAHNEGIMMALTHASYNEEGSLRGSTKRQSIAQDFQGSDMGSSVDGSSRRGDEDDSDDDASMQSRRIQVALKNLVSAM